MGVEKEVKTKWRSMLHLFIPYSLCVIVLIAAILLLGMMMINSSKEKLETNTQNSIERAFERVQMQQDVIFNIALHIGNNDTGIQPGSDSEQLLYRWAIQGNHRNNICGG